MGDNWLGAGAIILDGVTLGKGTVVGAGAVVTRAFPMAKIIAGNPARVIKDRAPQGTWDFLFRSGERLPGGVKPSAKEDNPGPDQGRVRLVPKIRRQNCR